MRLSWVSWSLSILVHRKFFYDDIMKFAENLKKKGNEVEVLETLNAAHVPYRLGKNWNLEDAQAICLTTMTKFLEKTGV